MSEKTSQAGRPELKLSIENIEAQIKTLHGNISAVANVFGVHRHTISNRIKKSDRLSQALHNAREAMIDNVESKLYENALAGQETSVIFFLKTQGKSRGYVERQEMQIGEAVPLNQEKAHILNKVYAGISTDTENSDEGV